MSDTVKWIGIAVLSILAVAVLYSVWGMPGGIIGALPLLGGLARKRSSIQQADSALSAEVELGVAHVMQANEQADEEVRDGMEQHDNLADYLNSLDHKQ